MGSTGQPIERMEALQALMDRLISPDLTLGEAKDLRHRLFALTGVDDEAEAVHQGPAHSVPCEGQRNGRRSPGCRNFAA